MQKYCSLAFLFLALGLCPVTVSAQDAVPAAQAATAPGVIFSASPAMLIRIDGDPVYCDVESTTLQRIVNTKALILRDFTGSYYLKILDGWMETYSLDGWWMVADVLPDGADVALSRAAAAKSVDLLEGGKTLGSARPGSLGNGGAPTVYVSTTPTVLIVTDGAPRFSVVAGTSLEFLENTTAKVFKEPTDQELYLSLSGRWLRAWTTKGPWQFISSDQLPADLAQIPDSRLK